MCRAAPELLKEQECTMKSDVWSFGIVMWEVKMRLVVEVKIE